VVRLSTKAKAAPDPKERILWCLIRKIRIVDDAVVCEVKASILPRVAVRERDQGLPLIDLGTREPCLSLQKKTAFDLQEQY
jgi:hypothetical protein